MSDEKDIKFKLNLDSKEFVEAGLHAKEVIKGIGESESIAGLIEGLAATGVALGAVGIAAYAFKSAIDLTLEAEQIKKVEKSFEILAENAGISSHELKAGMESAAAGLIDTGDLLKIANEAIVKMGSSAERLPEIMELARKATVVFGGDLTSNFENITNAIANGNTRMLKHYGILVDAKKAVDDFAKANGLAVNEISAAGKQQAILNAALEQSKTAFGGINTDTETATTLLASLKTDVKEMGETFVLWFEDKMGPSVRGFLKSMKEMSSQVRTSMTSIFGSGMSQVDAQVANTENRLKSLKEHMAALQSGNQKVGFFSKLMHGDKDSQITEINLEIAQTTAQLEGLRIKQGALAADDKTHAAEKEATRTKANAKDIADQEIHLANAIKFKAEMEKIDKAYHTAQMQNVQTFQEIDENVRDQNELAARQHATRLQEINKSTYLDSNQKFALLLNEERKYGAEVESIERRNDVLRKQMLDNYVKNSKSTFDGVERAFQANIKKMKADMDDFGKQGQETFDSFKTYSTSAFETMGAEMAKGRDIASATADAIKSIFLNMIADKAIAAGSAMLLESVFPPNPLGLAGGAALIALGGALRSVSGSSFGSGSSVSAVSLPTVGGVSGGATNITPLPPPTSSSADTPDMAASSQLNMERNQAPQRIVNVNIAGNYMETDATRRQLMEMMRQETDATDFTYNKVGV